MFLVSVYAKEMGSEKCDDRCNVDLDIFWIIRRNVTAMIERTSLVSKYVVCVIVYSEVCDVYGVSKL